MGIQIKLKVLLTSKLHSYGVNTVKNQLLTFLTSIFVTGVLSLQAEVQTEDISTQNISTATSEKHCDPFTVDVLGDYIGKAKVHDCNKGHLTFITGTADLNFVYYYNECCQEGANAALAYQRTFLDWTTNPYFTEKNFDTLSLILGAFTKRLPDWLWKAQVSINFDNLEHWNFDDYMNYDMLLWGRYDYCENIGIHIGFLAQTGMKIDRVYPIIGIDWTCGKWKLNAIFPMNISAVYSFTPEWSVAVAGRFFDQRHRVREDEYLSEGLWHYQGGGAELAVNYSPDTWLSANVHAGYSLGGHLKIADRHYHHGHRLRVDGAPYAGAEVIINF